MSKVGGGRQPKFLSAHPSPEHRAEALRELGAKVQPGAAAVPGGEGASASAGAPCQPDRLAKRYSQI